MEETGTTTGNTQAVNGIRESRKDLGEKENVSISVKSLIAAFALLSIVIVGGVGGYFYFDYMDQWISTNNAHIEGRIYTVASEIPGVIRTVMFEENNPVSKGDLLFEIDSTMQKRKMIKSPSDGYVANLLVEAGEFVSPGQPLTYVVNNDNLWITANFTETQIRHIRIGQDVDIYVDAFPNESFKGRIASVMPASGSTFALFPPDATAGNWVRTPQRIPVKISFIDAIDQEIKLRIGMLASVRVER